MLTPELCGILSSELEPAYTHMIEHYPDFAHDRHRVTRSPLCKLWSRIALPLARDALRASQIEVFHVTYHEVPDRYSYETGGRHQYLLGESVDRSERFLMDGTWQQYRSGYLPTIPEKGVLISRVADVTDELTEYGIETRYHEIWLPPETPSTNFEIKEIPSFRPIRGISR